MNRLISISARILLLIFAIVTPQTVKADENSLQDRFKASLNQMVLDVQKMDNPDAKRQALGDFLLRLDRGMVMAEKSPLLSAQDKKGMNAFEAKFRSDYAELNGLEGREKIANADLDHFAVFVQQDMEQADYIIISAGGCLIILIILLILL